MRTPATHSTLDLACFSLEDRRLVVLTRTTTTVRDELPWSNLDASTDLTTAADALAADALGGPPAWIAQLGARAAAPGDSAPALSVAYVAIARAGTPPPAGHRWFDTASGAALNASHARIVDQGLESLRERMDIIPVAFHLMPLQFTLPQLQAAYEVLLAHSVHKASFRRALLAAELIVPTDDSTSEARGRPARLYRYEPGAGGRRARSARFDLLG